MSEPILVSACLLGLLTRYDGVDKTNTGVRDFLDRHNLLPVPICPEQLGGMPTPRPATEFSCGDGEAILDRVCRLQNRCGDDVTDSFIRGASQSVGIARLCGTRKALLKERSPSCGVRQVYRNRKIVPGRGVTAALLAREGLTLLTEEDI
ncbi:MAG: DUF523 domain-containing protein [Desulfuromonas sp.]|nr:MAG: DUF523 domain-containing protein [Desulfuromonas sp.]